MPPASLAKSRQSAQTALRNRSITIFHEKPQSALCPRYQNTGAWKGWIKVILMLRRFANIIQEEMDDHIAGCVALTASRDAFLTAAIGWMPVLVVRVCGDQRDRLA